MKHRILSFAFITTVCFSFVIKEQALNIRKDKDHALFFAISNYKEWNDLKNPVRDAEAIAQILESEYDFETDIQRNSTKNQIRAKILEYQKRIYAQDEQLLLYFSGHGEFVPFPGKQEEGKGFFIPADARQDDPFKDSYLFYGDFLLDIDNIPCQHILVIIDACYSGAIFDMKGRPGEYSDRDKYIRDVMRYTTRIAITSGGKERTKDGANHSPMTKRILKVFSERAGIDGLLTYAELYGGVQGIVPRPQMGEFGKHHPSGDFVFMRDMRIAIETVEKPVVKKREEAEYGIEADIAAWKKAKKKNTCFAYQQYINAFPKGEFKALAEAKSSTCGMVLVRGGTFQMGDMFGEGQNDEKPVHIVMMPDFWLGESEVTFEEYDAFCASTGKEKPDDNNWGRGKRPVIDISWHDAVAYCNWHSKTEGLTPCYTINGKDVNCNWTANGYRLPTEAEWEYAAREEGIKVRFGNGKNIANPDEINFDGSTDYKTRYSTAGIYRGKTMPVQSFFANALGLYDMSGNVYEWCWDWYKSDYYQKCKNKGTIYDPKGPVSGSDRVLRGGSWLYEPAVVRAALRDYSTPTHRGSSVGFRLAKTRVGP